MFVFDEGRSFEKLCPSVAQRRTQVGAAVAKKHFLRSLLREELAGFSLKPEARFRSDKRENIKAKKRVIVTIREFQSCGKLKKKSRRETPLHF